MVFMAGFKTTCFLQLANLTAYHSISSYNGYHKVYCGVQSIKWATGLVTMGMILIKTVYSQKDYPIAQKHSPKDTNCKPIDTF